MLLLEFTTIEYNTLFGFAGCRPYLQNILSSLVLLEATVTKPQPGGLQAGLPGLALRAGQEGAAPAWVAVKEGNFSYHNMDICSN